MKTEGAQPDKIWPDMFRKLYWVVEEDMPSGRAVSGVYTSVHDLIEHGLGGQGLSLTLTPLDKRNSAVGLWSSFESLASDLEPLMKSNELRIDEVNELVEALKS